jgi:hypothetical protein
MEVLKKIAQQLTGIERDDLTQAETKIAQILLAEGLLRLNVDCNYYEMRK